MSMRRHQGGPETPPLAAACRTLSTANLELTLAETTPAEQIQATSGLNGAVDERLVTAIAGLLRTAPLLSACTSITRGQVVSLSIFVGTFFGLGVALPEVALFLISVLLSVPILCGAVFRTAAICELSRRPIHQAPRLDDSDLPTYSILVPLLREAGVLPRLLKALGALDYPPAKLDIQLVVESSDPETRDALAAIRLPSHFRVIVVPDASPRTKPKALNYALPDARGELLVIFDAEDAPEPDQLRRGAEAFAAASTDLVCLQARLAIERRNCWLEQQFAIEYASLFDALLPALERWRLPLPLGGTSNHFRVSALRAAGGWDPYNVTEDADLGIRLARMGFRVGTFRSTTWELAPETWSNWRNQRTRWLKGWMQTYLVHTRAPARLAADLGLRGTIGFHILFGGMLLAVLAYPIGLALLAWAVGTGQFLATPETNLENWLWWASLANLSLGFASSMLLATMSVSRRRWSGLVWRVLWMPVYWLAISVAGYRALWQLASDPFRWEKTDHGEP